MKLAHDLKVASVASQGTDAVLLSFALSADQEAPFGFVPGQYLTIAAGPAGNEQWRCYSLTSDPQDRARISVLVRRVRDGLVSNWLCDHARAGQELQVLPPAGRFTLRQPGQPALLFAGGSGIAPIFSLARQALLDGAPRVGLFYANRDRATAMLMDELEQLKAFYADRLDLRCWYDAEQGLPTAPAIAACAAHTAAPDAYLCGPEPFMHSVQGVLSAAGMEAGHILCEEFATDPVAQTASAAGEESDKAEDCAVLSVRLKGQLHQLPAQKKDTLLNAMIKAGLPVPHACKVGECASCMCRLVSGDIERLSSSVLDDDDVEAGWLVACRTRAVGAEVSIKFA